MYVTTNSDWAFLYISISACRPVQHAHYAKTTYHRLHVRLLPQNLSSLAQSSPDQLQDPMKPVVPRKREPMIDIPYRTASVRRFPRAVCSS